MLANMYDIESENSLKLLDEFERVRRNRVAGVRTVLVVLSSAWMVFDPESLRQMILLAYPDSVVFFYSTCGKSLGISPPYKTDLLIDFTGPEQRQAWLFIRKLRRMARVAIGRKGNWLRQRLYDRVFNDKQVALEDIFARESIAQKEVLALAGVAVVPTALAGADLEKDIALTLPPLSHG